MAKAIEELELISPADASNLTGVCPKTLGRWADAGKISSIRTLGGHRRFIKKEIEALIKVTDIKTKSQKRSSSASSKRSRSTSRKK